MGRLAVATLIAAGGLTLASCHSSKGLSGSGRSIVVLYENDVHCAIDGYTKLAGLRDAIGDTADVLVVSSGDYIQGNVAGTLSKGAFPVKIMRSVGYDALTLGNHEFDFAIPRQRKLTRKLRGRVVCANLVEMPSGRTVYKPYILCKAGDKRVAFIGVVTPSTMNSDRFAFYTPVGDGERQRYSLVPDEVYRRVQWCADEARRNGADYVIVLAHLGDDPTDEGIESPGLVRNTRGIDLVLDGHTHEVIPHDTVLNADGKPVIVTQTGSELQNIGKLLITSGGRISVELLPSKQIEARNERVSRKTERVKAKMDKEVSRKIGHTETTLQLLDEKGDYLVRYAETNAGDLANDAFRWATGAELAISNGGGLRNEVPAGDLTYGDFMKLMPYDNNVVLIEAKGSQILEVLNRCAVKNDKDNGDFPQCSGLRYTVNLASRTVSNVQVEQEGKWVPLEANRTYRVATIDYCVAGGGFGRIFAGCSVIQKSDINYRDVLADYVKTVLDGTVGGPYLKPQGRITVVSK